jgi:hypothetical protein
MIQITGITSIPSQTFNIPDPVTRKTIYFSLYFSARTQNWFMDIRYETFEAKGLKVVRGLNILSRHINTLPFGLSVVIPDNFEPFLINDFTSGRVFLYLLTHDECLEVKNMIIAGATIP